MWRRLRLRKFCVVTYVWHKNTGMAAKMRNIEVMYDKVQVVDAKNSASNARKYIILCILSRTICTNRSFEVLRRSC